MRLAAAMVVGLLPWERPLFPKTLESIKNVVDDIVIVATDNQQEIARIARPYGAHILWKPWANDFALHRNQSIELAERLGTDWFLVIDADEELAKVKTPIPMLKTHFSNVAPEIHELAVVVKNYRKMDPLEEGAVHASSRWFRTGVGIYYKHYIHNERVSFGQAASSDFLIHHYGFGLGPEVAKAKCERTVTALKRRAKDNPEDPRPWRFICMSYLTINRLQEGIDAAKKSLELLAQIKEPLQMVELEFYFVLYHSVGMSYYHLGQIGEALKWVSYGLTKIPDDINLQYDMVHIGKSIHNKDLIQKHGPEYLRLVDEWKRAGMITQANRPVMTADEQSQERVRGWLREANE